MDENALHSLKHMETQLEYLRSIENLMERLVAATEAMRVSNERLQKSMEQAWQTYNTISQDRKR